MIYLESLIYLLWGITALFCTPSQTFKNHSFRLCVYEGEIIEYRDNEPYWRNVSYTEQSYSDQPQLLVTPDTLLATWQETFADGTTVMNHGRWQPATGLWTTGYIVNTANARVGPLWLYQGYPRQLFYVDDSWWYVLYLPAGWQTAAAGLPNRQRLPIIRR